VAVVARLNVIALAVWGKVLPIRIAQLVMAKVFIAVQCAMALEK
jgi:hypothetical protein